MTETEMPVTERVRIGSGGWIRIEANPGRAFPDQFVPPAHVLYCRVGYTPANPERLALLEVFTYRSDGGPVEASAWRKFRLGRIEAWINEPDQQRTIGSRLDAPGPLLRIAASHYATSFGKPTHWVAEMLRSQVGESKWVDERPEHSSDWTVRVEQPDLDAQLKVERRKEGRRVVDEFYEDVARVYREITAYRGDPAPIIADANNIPLSTAHYWIREARDRGFLPQGKRGKVG